jgi:hypothetical protein
MLFERLDYSWSRTLAMLAAHPALGRHIGSIDADLYAEAGFFILRLSHLFPNLDSIGYLTFPGRVQVTDVPRSPLRLEKLGVDLEWFPDLAVSLASLVDARTLQSLVVIFFELHFLADLGRFTNLRSLSVNFRYPVVLPARALAPFIHLRELSICRIDTASVLSQTLPALKTLTICGDYALQSLSACAPDDIRARPPSLSTVRLSNYEFGLSGGLQAETADQLGALARCLREANVRFIDCKGIAWQADWDATP